MNELTFSGDGNIYSEENVKNILLKVFILYSVLSFLLFLSLNFSDVRMFNSLNLTMSIVSTGGFYPRTLDKIIKTNPQNNFIFLNYFNA